MTAGFTSMALPITRSGRNCLRILMTLSCSRVLEKEASISITVSQWMDHPFRFANCLTTWALHNIFSIYRFCNLEFIEPWRSLITLFFVYLD